MILNRNAAYSGRKALLKTKRAVYVSYCASVEFKKNLLTLARGMKILGGRVEPSQLIELAVNVTRKSARHKGRRKMIGSAITLDYTLPRKRYFKIHIPATLRVSAAKGEFPRVSWESLRAKLLRGRSKVTLVVVLDSSASMIYSIRGILTALKAVEKEARKYRDRVALIVCKGSGAKIAQHPTTNFNLVLSKMSRIGLDDFTPLASGMYLGYNVALRERRKGYEPVIVVISDGNANVPLERRRAFRRFSFDPAVQSVLDVASLIAKSRIETIVINTKHREVIPGMGETLISGTELLLNVARITKGSYVGIVG